MNQRLIQEIEDEYYMNLRSLNQKEEELTDYYREFQHRTTHLIETIYQVFKDVEEGDERNRFIYQLEENQDQYYRQYCQDVDAIEEERQTQWRLFNQRVEELAAEAKKDQ